MHRWCSVVAHVKAFYSTLEHVWRNCDVMYHVQCIVIFTNPSNHILFWDTWRKRTSSGTSSPASCFSHTMSLRGDTTVPRAGELNDRAAWVKAKYGQEWAPSKVRTLELVNQSESSVLKAFIFWSCISLVASMSTIMSTSLASSISGNGNGLMSISMAAGEGATAKLAETPLILFDEEASLLLPIPAGAVSKSLISGSSFLFLWSGVVTCSRVSISGILKNRPALHCVQTGEAK